MATFYSFDEKSIAEALDAARQTHDGAELKAIGSDFDTSRGGDLQLLAQCISVTVENQRICINLPLGFGKHCISIPIRFPNGTAGKACLHICTTWGIPTGIKVTIEIGGVVIVSQKFGKC